MPNDISEDHLQLLRQLTTSFADLPDHRQPGKVCHPLGEVLAIAFCAMVCGYSHYTEMEIFAEDQEQWLNQFLEMDHGVPSHDTFRNVFTSLSPDVFAEVLAEWGGKRQKSSDEHITVDGKAICGTGVHLVRAWVDSIGLSIGQVACEDKSNEIEAIPRLLNQLNLKENLVSIDAMGCQLEIASQIEAAGGYYLLALKGNQKSAFDIVKSHMDAAETLAEARTEEMSRGRYEARTCSVEQNLSFFGKSWKWEGITTVVKVRSEICRKNSSGTDGSEAAYQDRYFLCSLPLEQSTPEKLLALVRNHWSVENRCHWVLDVIFGEDQCPVRDKIAARNLSTMRGMVMALLKNDPAKGSMKSKRQRAALNPAFRAKIISSLHA